MNKIQEKANLIFGKINVRCPHCNSLMRFTSLDIYLKKVFYYVGTNDERKLEIENINCICHKCNGVLRISNGSTIKRERNFIEISSQVLFLITMIPFFVCMVLIFFIFIQYKENEPMSISIVFPILILSTLALTMIGLFLIKKYPNIGLYEDINNNNTLESTLNYIPSIYERDGLYNENALLYEKNLLNEQKISEQAKEISELKPILTLNLQNPFESENVLQLHLANNVQHLRFNDKPLSLFQGNKAIEFTTSIGRIDILLTDNEGNFYIVETKLDKIPDKTIGQISRYMGWVNEHINPNGKNVYGLIIGLRHGEKSKYAVKIHPNIYLFEYTNGIFFKNII